MSWLALALATAVLYALQGAWTKRLEGRASELAATWALFAFAFPILLVWLLIEGAPSDPGGRFWVALGVNSVLDALAFWLYVSAIQRGDLGLTYPLLSLTPILLVPVEWALLGDTPPTTGLAGIVLVVAGVYVLNFSPDRTGLLSPFAALTRDPGARRMLGVAVIWAVSGTVDRVAVLGASTGLYGTLLTAALTLIFLPALWRGGRLRILATGARANPGAAIGRGVTAETAAAAETSAAGDDGWPEARNRSRIWAALVLQGVLFALTFIFQMEALQLTLAANVITIKRSGALLTVIFGALWFGEGFAAWRLAGTAVILAGVLLVAG